MKIRTANGECSLARDVDDRRGFGIPVARVEVEMGERMGACVACLTMLVGGCGGSGDMPAQMAVAGQFGSQSMAPSGLPPDPSTAPDLGAPGLGSAGVMGAAGDMVAPPASGSPGLTPTPVTPMPVTPMPGPGLMPVTGGAPAAGGTGGGMAVGMPPAANDGSDSGAAGEPSDGGGTGMPAPPGKVDPIIPEIEGECPNFQSGSQRIMELQTEVVAGPPGSTPGPLLFAWHGTGGTGSLGLLQVPASVKNDIMRQGGIIIAPTASGVRSGQDVTFVLGVWYDGHDLELADLIVACAVKNHNIDPRRIYATGCSAGGLMTGTMALQRSSYVAAAAPNSGGIAIPLGGPQDSSRIPAIFAMHGGSGDNVIVNFQDTTNNLAGVLVPAGSFFVDCNHNSGHCGAPTSLHEAAWEFMKAHPFGTSPSPYADGLPASFPSYCMVR